jgi:predicted ester cyclase
VTSEDNKRLARRIPEDVFNRGNLEVADEVMASDYVEHVSVPGFAGGVAGFKQFVAAFREAFPDFHYVVEDEIAEGDRVVQRLSAHGTMRGPFAGMAATGKRATWSEIHTCRLAGGKVVEHWANADQIGMLQQLGLIPIPG